MGNYLGNVLKNTKHGISAEEVLMHELEQKMAEIMDNIVFEHVKELGILNILAKEATKYIDEDHPNEF